MNKPRSTPDGRSPATNLLGFVRQMRGLSRLFHACGSPAQPPEDDRQAPAEPVQQPIDCQELDGDEPTVIEEHTFQGLDLGESGGDRTVEIREAQAMYRDSQGRARFVTIMAAIAFDPIPQHKACYGCQWHCGQTNGGHHLVCGMYPMGPTQTPCPDWQTKAKKGPDPFASRGL